MHVAIKSSRRLRIVVNAAVDILMLILELILLIVLYYRKLIMCNINIMA